MAVYWGGVAGMICFYIVILVIGLWASRKTKSGGGKSTAENVMVAGRNIGCILGIFTLTATWVGGGYINGAAEVMFKPGYGFAWGQAPWGYAISLLLDGILFAKPMRAKNYVTMLDPFEHKYGNRMCGLLFLPAFLGEVLWCASILAALGATISVIVAIDKYLATIISAAISALYTLFGGLYSVAYTDVVQLGLIFIGLWACIPFALTNEAVEPLEQTKSEWLGEVDSSYAGVWIDKALLLMFGGIAWQAYFQRALSAKTPQQAQTISIVAAFGCLFFSIPGYLMGAIGASTDWNMTDLNLNTTNPYESPDIILPVVMQYLTPPAVSFLGLGAVAAAVMSSTDSSVLSSSSMFARNVYKGIFRQKARDREILWVMRIAIIGVTALATVLALTVDSIYILFVLCSDLVYVILFPQLLCVVYVRWINTYGSLFGYIIGFFLRVGGGEASLNIPPFIHYPFYDPDKGQLFPFRFLAMITSLISILVISYATNAVFQRGLLDKKWDVFRCVRSAEELKYNRSLNDLRDVDKNDEELNGLQMEEKSRKSSI